MRTLIAVTSLAMALTPALAQPVLDKIPNRHPAYADTFSQRWEQTLKGREIDGVPVRTFRVDPKDMPTKSIPGSHPVLSGELMRGALVEATPVPSGYPVPKTVQNSPTALPEAVGIVPVPGNRLRHDPIRTQHEPVPKAKTLAAMPSATVTTLNKPNQATCLRHNLRTVWTGQSWRCRK